MREARGIVLSGKVLRPGSPIVCVERFTLEGAHLSTRDETIVIEDLDMKSLVHPSENRHLDTHPMFDLSEDRLTLNGRIFSIRRP